MESNQIQPRPRGRCRFCGSALDNTFVDLGMSPLCESYVSIEHLNEMEPFYPLHVYVCSHCFLVQLEEYVSPENIFSEYAYFSAFSDSWLKHASDYVEMITDRLGLTPHSRVIEVASNDGYLLQYFVERGIPALGIEPAANVAKAAEGRGVQTLVQFFGEKTATEVKDQYGSADLVIANNVLAQVPDLNDFVTGFKKVLSPRGTVTLEFPHLQRLMAGNQFDTIYHEHFSYFSFITAEKIFLKHGLKLYDVEELPTHGGSLRLYAGHLDDRSKNVSPAVVELRKREFDLGFENLGTYFDFDEKVKETKRQILDFLIKAKRSGKTIVGYGAPGKGNTLLNYCGIRTDFIDYTVDRNPYKQGKYLPGTRIPILPPERIQETRPDYLFVLPWNLKEEIMEQMDFVRSWGCRFAVPIPEMKLYP